MNIFSVLGAIGIVLGVASTGAAIFYAARTQYGKSTIEALQSDVDNWKDRVAERDARIEHLEDEMERKNHALQRMGRQLEDQESQIRDLREMVLQRVEFAQLVEATTAHEHAAQDRMQERKREHSQMMAAITKLTEEVHVAQDLVKKLGVVIHEMFRYVKDKIK